MKFVLLFAVFLLFVDKSLQLPQLLNCTSDYEPPSSIANGCGVFTCDGENVSGVGCVTYRCSPRKCLGYTRPDNSKPYPKCCGGPICAD